MAITKIHKTTPEEVAELGELIELIAHAKKEASENNQYLPYYSDEIKQRAVDLHFKLGTAVTRLSVELGLGISTLTRWMASMKCIDKGHATGQMHGTTVRYDIPTKCLIVKQHIEDGVEIHKLAVKYNVSQAAISTWKTTYKDLYEVYIDLPPGTMIIGKESKRISGLNNILIVMERLEADREAIKQMIELMHNNGVTTRLAEDTLSSIDSDINIIKKGEDALSRNT